MVKVITDPVPRFWAKVMPEPNSGCWLWLGSISGEGYGSLAVNAGQKQAHRWSYEHFVGPIPDGLQIDHLCRVRCCVNPSHLEAVTQRENGLRGFGAAALNARKTKCANGHDFTPENTIWRKGGGRACRTCQNLFNVQYRLRKKEGP